MSHLGLFAVAAVALLSVAVHSDAASVVNHHQWSSSFRGTSGVTDGSKTVVKRQADSIGTGSGMIGGGAEAAKGGIDAAKVAMQTPIEMAKTGAAGGIQAAEKVQG
ncbi:uncharacterized protein LOC126100330 [Schistocerca cancellata]|uniref:uncharacterized protein LOC126100330 n=1 Tax=Schistocerca cancellata TaxID=274614 RepID=UPI002117BB75|nr:uncharacterized protein LOC126100330 [Schistocerca cancellata]